jgi:membrane protein DedA with SNARE-associated domain
MNFWLAICMGIYGSWLGALFNYYLALWLGRPLLLKWGSTSSFQKEFLRRAKSFFRRMRIGTFNRAADSGDSAIHLSAGRHCAMNLLHFLFYTGLGAGIWMVVLTWIGYVAGQNQELIHQYSREATIAALAGCAILIAVYTWWYRRKKRRQMTGSH